jgi:hypothetical protein
MKNILNSKDTKFSLQKIENYKKNVDTNLNEMINTYAQLLIEYFKFIIDNNKIDNTQFMKFIIIRGLSSITNIFLYLLYYTKNIELTHYHCQKSYYFYVEFISQISEDEKMFLQLTSRDAIIYIYKKTIFDINNEYKKANENSSIEFREKLDMLKNYTNLYQTYLLKIIQSPIIYKTNIKYIIKLTDVLKNVQNKTKISILTEINEKLYYKIPDVHKFFEINDVLVNQLCKTQDVLQNMLKNIENKINETEFDEKLNTLDTDKFVAWLCV